MPLEGQVQLVEPATTDAIRDLGVPGPALPIDEVGNDEESDRYVQREQVAGECDLVGVAIVDREGGRGL